MVLPTPLAETFAFHAKGQRAYIAPELCDENRVASPSVRSDLYGLGQLAWTLLTGRCGRDPAFILPSDVSSSLEPWDEFIDACCRAHSERRPADLQEGLALLPQRQRITKIDSATAGPLREVESPQAQTRRYTAASDAKVSRQFGLPRRLPRRLVLAGGGLAAASGLLSWRRAASATKHGFADTVISFPQRSYQGASWKRIHSVEALRGVLPSGRCNYLHFAHIVGQDDNNLWITAHRDRTAVFFQLKNGHWEYRQTVGEDLSWDDTECLVQRPHLLNPDTLIPCVEDAFYEVTSAAIRKISKHPNNDALFERGGPCGVAIISDDYYFHTMGDQSFYDAYAVHSGKATLLDDGTKKEAFIYSADFNAPLEEYRVKSIGFPASFRRGHSIGVCAEYRMAKIVEFREGRWWSKADVTLTDMNQTPAMDGNKIRDAFFGTLDGRTPGYAILCGPAGTVLFLDLKGREEERSVVPRQETTTAELIKAWGAHPELYWVMDGKGEIWERNNRETRVVVRGLHDSDLMDSGRGFRTAWVSPSGNVFAATKEHLFRLG